MAGGAAHLGPGLRGAGHLCRSLSGAGARGQPDWRGLAGGLQRGNPAQWQGGRAACAGLADSHAAGVWHSSGLGLPGRGCERRPAHRNRIQHQPERHRRDAPGRLRLPEQQPHHDRPGGRGDLPFPRAAGGPYRQRGAVVGLGDGAGQCRGSEAAGRHCREDQRNPVGPGAERSHCAGGWPGDDAGHGGGADQDRNRCPCRGAAQGSAGPRRRDHCRADRAHQCRHGAGPAHRHGDGGDQQQRRGDPVGSHRAHQCRHGAWAAHRHGDSRDQQQRRGDHCRANGAHQRRQRPGTAGRWRLCADKPAAGG